MKKLLALVAVLIFSPYASAAPLVQAGDLNLTMTVRSSSDIIAAKYFGDGSSLTGMAAVTYPIGVSSGGTGNTNRTLTDSGAQTSIDWEARRAIAPPNILAIDWFNRTLNDSGGSSTLNWSGGLLSNGVSSSLSWINRVLYNTTSAPVLDWSGPTITGDGSNLTMLDNGFMVKNNADTTKHLVFDMSGVPTGSTVTIAPQAGQSVRYFLSPGVTSSTATILAADGATGIVLIGTNTRLNGSNAGVQYTSSFANRAQYRVNAYGNHNGVSGMTCTKSRGSAIGVLDAPVQVGDSQCRITVAGAGNTAGSLPNNAMMSWNAAQVNATTVATDWEQDLMNQAGVLAKRAYLTSEGKLLIGPTIASTMTAYNLDVNGSAVASASMTANAFFGDGSHLTGLPAGETNTFTSSKTFTSDVHIGGVLDYPTGSIPNIGYALGASATGSGAVKWFDSIDMNNRFLTTAGANVVDWAGFTLNTAGNTASIDWNNRILLNNSGSPRLNWNGATTNTIGVLRVNNGLNIVYRCSGGVDDTILASDSSNASRCVGGVWVATSLKVD